MEVRELIEKLGSKPPQANAVSAATSRAGIAGIF